MSDPTPAIIVLSQLTRARLGNLAEPVPDKIRARVHLRGHYAVMIRVAALNDVAARGTCTGTSKKMGEMRLKSSSL